MGHGPLQASGRTADDSARLSPSRSDAPCICCFSPLILTGQWLHAHRVLCRSASERSWRSFRVFAIIAGLLLVVSPRARSFARQWMATITAFAVLAAVVSFLLSLGPEIRTEGRMIGRAGTVLVFLLERPGIRRPSGAGAIRDARRAVSCDCRRMRRRRDRTASSSWRSHSPCSGRTRRCRSVRRAHHSQWHCRRNSLCDAACAGVHGRGCTGSVPLSENAPRPRYRHRRVPARRVGLRSCATCSIQPRTGTRC